MDNKDNILKWQFDVNTFRLLGRDLITDRITALFELVKNSYDANAENVTISFINIVKRNESSKILITDDGLGMSLDDIKNKWMVIGANSKRINKYSPKPFNRRFIGEKGIGRFAVDKLGQYVRIRTKQIGDTQQLVVTINWQTYEDLSKQQQSLKLFTEIENEFYYENATFEKGTIIEILEPREIWNFEDIERSNKELSRLVSPFTESKFPFNIKIYAPEFAPYSKPITVSTIEKDFASHSFKLEYDEDMNLQDSLIFDKDTSTIKIFKTAKQSFGFVKFYLFYFDRDSKNRFNSYYKDSSVRIDGIKIYRDGILTTPFAEYEADDEKRRDVLGINKRRWRATFDRIGTRDVIGFLEISREGNPDIIDSTNRQDFLNTPQYRELKEFIYHQLDIFMESRIAVRNEKSKENISSFEDSKKTISEIQKEFRKLRTEKFPKESLSSLEKQVAKLEIGLVAITNEYKETKKEEERKEKMYFSLMSLSLFAANISHAVRTIIYSIKDDVSFIKDEPISEDTLPLFKNYSKRIHREIKRLLLVTDFMLKYAKADLPSEYYNVKKMIEDTFDAHQTIFEAKKINIQLIIGENISILCNNVFFQDIFTNLISNSIKALEPNFDKKIKCSVTTTSNDIQVLFSDNGIGIPSKNWEKVFDVYFTTTAEQGGAGIGLFVVKTNTEALGGKIAVIESIFAPHGTTFSINIPFKK